jgi:hypothetical protein
MGTNGIDTTSLEDIAAKVVDAAGAAGGIDEVERIAHGGWPADVEVATLDARTYEDFDECLAEAAGDVADALGLEPWECDARWPDRDRETIVVTSSSVDLKARIQACAQALLEAVRS